MQGAAEWNHLFHELRRYREEHKQEGPPFKWRDPVADFTSSLARWYHKQPDLFKQRLLLPDEVCQHPHACPKHCARMNLEEQPVHYRWGRYGSWARLAGICER